jgi:class 3 adenylate cyclase
MDDILLAATVLGTSCAGLGVMLLAARVRGHQSNGTVLPGDLEVTVVACDLPGFSAYAGAVPPRAVNGLLAEYHAAVGCAVAEVDGTVEDVSADSIRVVVGASRAPMDHASAGLDLARRIHEVTAPVIERWSTGAHPIGIGVGVAQGLVTVGPSGKGVVLARGRDFEPVHDGRSGAYLGVTPPFSGRF